MSERVRHSRMSGTETVQMQNKKEKNHSKQKQMMEKETVLRPVILSDSTSRSRQGDVSHRKSLQ